MKKSEDYLDKETAQIRRKFLKLKTLLFRLSLSLVAANMLTCHSLVVVILPPFPFFNIPPASLPGLLFWWILLLEPQLLEDHCMSAKVQSTTKEMRSPKRELMIIRRP